MLFRLLLFPFLFFVISAEAQPSGRNFFASRHCRDSVAGKLRNMAEQTLQLPLSDSTEQQWSAACWAMELMLYRPAGLQQLIPQHIQQLPHLSASLQRSYLEMLYTLYPVTFYKHLYAIVPMLTNEKVKAMAWEYVITAAPDIDYSQDQLFRSSRYYEPFVSQRIKHRKPYPRIDDFKDSSFLPGQTVMCSFQYTDRNKPGFLMIRTAEGEWIRNKKGERLQFPQLARSVTNLPYYLTNGNTPQGLYRITGTGISSNQWIGPTANLQMELPFETGITFFGTDSATLTTYKNLLGAKLGRYEGLYESYTAGILGRSEIIAHGTTIDPEFYRHEPYYPLTPSLGCLCSPEQWNEQGERMRSIQQEWMQVYHSLQLKPTFLIVAEIRFTEKQ
jgi:hypothetical protein